MPLNVEVKKKIDEKAIYVLSVVKVPDTPVDVYGIIHKDNDVLEMSTSVLCNARKMLTALEEWESGGQASGELPLPEILG
jgi:hypothetical protein